METSPSLTTVSVIRLHILHTHLSSVFPLLDFRRVMSWFNCPLSYQSWNIAPQSPCRCLTHYLADVFCRPLNHLPGAAAFLTLTTTIHEIVAWMTGSSWMADSCCNGPIAMTCLTTKTKEDQVTTTAWNLTSMKQRKGLKKKSFGRWCALWGTKNIHH